MTVHLLSFTPRELRHESHRSDRIFDCHQCGRSYQMRHNLVKHLRFECGGQKHFACYLCPARYTQNGKLRQHMLNAHDIFVPPRKTWIRSSCFYESFPPPDTSAMIYDEGTQPTFTKIARARMNSRRNTENTEDQSLQCSACGKKYSLKHNLARHMRFECGGQRRFCCHLCPNKYTQNVSLQRHLSHHHNVLVPVKRRHNGPRKICDGIIYQ
ncbi:hypothetical protein DMN91_012835 [Ooceraea biroi]|uniref:C2H2-type domain-containing protein n=1 Tax=Ooceraea biroi TaxID=2015173 RepID=A0A3L8D522_OOCBI|nr:hypothetical protein DMN91_012835 [Ooceraea biroi]